MTAADKLPISANKHSDFGFRISDFATGLLCLFISALPTWAADKSGVSPNTISLPKGPGSIEGLGDSFQPTLNTGTAKYGLGLKIPPGTAGHQPSLALSYEGGGGNGPLGYGWMIHLPHIQRQTDEGIPTYGDALGVDRMDTFVNESRELLVPTADGYFFCENEGAFVRYQRVSTHWEGTSPDGTRLQFGITAGGRVEDAATGHVFRWLLERATDTRGNTIEYTYRSFPGGQNLNQKYLDSVRYGPGSPPWTTFHFVEFEYESRPDWFEDARAGFLIRTGQRLRTIHVATQGVPLTNHLAGDFNSDGVTDFLNRRYDLEYLRYDGDASHWSLLAQVRLVGADGVTTLPPATFAYAVSHPPTTIDASSNVWASVNAPNSVMDNPSVDLIDLNADGLPDLLKTEAGGNGHTAALNRGPARMDGKWVIQWAPPASVDPGTGTAWNFDLASDGTHLADMDGDGLADLVHKTADESVFYFANRGRLAWSERRDMAYPDTAPPAPFGNPNVRTADIDFDKRIDVIQSIDIGGAIAYRVWFNRGNQSYSSPTTIEPEGGYDLAAAGVQIADCNGDRVPDIARIQPGAVVVVAGLGYGRFAAPLSLVLPDFTLDGQQIAKAKLADVNGDGLADLVLERAAPGQCWYWLNLGNYTLSPRRIITGLPIVNPGTVVRWADLNGNGSTDLIYADSVATPRLQMIELGALLSGGLAPNLLTRIGNGIGRLTTIEYAPSTQFAQADDAAGQPWPDSVPFPVTVVASVTTSDSLGHEYVTRYRYHDGYYDPAEKQFRGFANVEQIDVGDTTAPTLVNRSHFDTGRTFDAMKGRLLGSASETENGEVFSRKTITWSNPPRTVRIGTNGVLIRFAHPVETARDILERGSGIPRRLESDFAYDDYGNQIRASDYGIVENGNRSAFDDERTTVTEYALNLSRWIIRQPKRQARQDENGAMISKSELFYDDDTFAGNNLGEISIGNLTLRREWVNPGSATDFVNAARIRYDSYGNPVLLLDPLSDGTGDPMRGHFREVVYDSDFHSYPVRETIHIGDSNPALVFAAAYDQGLATIRSSSDFNLHDTRYAHDGLGRLLSVVRPGDSDAYPSAEYIYALGVPTEGGGVVNYIETRRRDQLELRIPKTEMYLRRREFSDGLGRTLMTRTEAEPADGGTNARVAVHGASLFNARRQPVRTLNPFFTTRTGALEQLLDFENIETPGWQGQFQVEGNSIALDLSAAHHKSMQYDATLRVIKTTNPDGTHSRLEFQPLATRTFDENDADPASSHSGTPTENFTDGLGRMIQVNETARLNDDGTPSSTLNIWTTRFQYDLNNKLIRLTDSQGNIKELHYDGLQRKTWMNDPDAGLSTNDYDAGSNLIATMDAKGQRITYTYDGANRILTEDYHDATSSEFSYDRTPDVAFHYDRPAGLVDQGDGTRSIARNVKGMVAWVEDSSGQEHTSYDDRGRIERTVKRILDPLAGQSLDPMRSALVAYPTTLSYDPMDRVVRMIYPDNDEVEYQYNARGLLQSIRGGPNATILSNVAYQASAQQRQIDYGNGVRTTYRYDNRLRLIKILTQESPAAGELIHFDYDLDPASNLRWIRDRRPESVVPPGDPRRNTQEFHYDDLYRLTQVRYHFAPSPAPSNGTIDYRYDRIGNLLVQSSDIEAVERGVPVVNLGNLGYGGHSGAHGRQGRQSGDPPGPHALTSIQRAPQTPRSFPYDANGNLNEMDGMRCRWDFRDRLVEVEDESMKAEYRYDFTGRRVLKKVYWKQGEPDFEGNQPVVNRPPSTTVTIYIGQHFEVRDHDQPVKYVFNGATRLAKVSGSLSPNERVQRLRLLAGWNLVSTAVTVENANSLLLSGAIESAYLWNPIESRYSRIETGQSIDASAVLWIKATTNVIIPLMGLYVDPSARTVGPGGSFVPAAGLEKSPLTPTAPRAWYYDAAAARWRTSLAELASLTELPTALAPGEAMFIQTETAFEAPMSNPDWRILYYHQDHLSSSSCITDARGMLVEENASYPFGTSRHHHRLQTLETHYGFAQKERDRESGLHYFEARYLAASFGRFMVLDPKYAHPDKLSADDFSGYVTNPQRLNLYSYSLNNPLKYTDPSGLEVWNPFTDDWDELDKGQTLINMMPFVGPAAGKIANFLGGSDYDTRSQLAQSATSVFKSETAGDIAELAAGFAASGGSLIRFLVQRGARAGTAVAAEGLIGSAENLAASAENASASSIKSAQTLVTAPSPPMAPVAPAAGVVHRPNTLVAVAETQLHSASAIFGEAASQAQTARWWAYVQRRLAETASERAAAMDLYNRGYRVKGAGAILKMIGDEANAIFGGVGF